MSIPVSTVVNVSITVGAQFPPRAGFGTLCVVTNEAGPLTTANRIKLYATIDEVAEDWNATDEAYKAANAFFSQNPRPVTLKIARRFESAQGGSLQGVPLVYAPSAVADGAFTISVDGDEQEITGLDFSGDTSLADQAATIEAGLQAIGTGGYSAATVSVVNSALVVTSGTTGATSSVSTATAPTGGTDVSGLFGLTSEAGAIVGTGVDAEDITTALNAIQDEDGDWYGLVFTKEVRDAAIVNAENAVVAAADWCEARVKVFGNTTNNPATLFSVVTTDIASVLKAGSYRRTITTYSSTPSQYPSASLLGRAFTVNFSQVNSTITLKFKQLPGITVERLTSSQKAVLDNKNANALVEVGASIMFAESYMANGSFLDELHGLDWLTNAIETNVFGYLLTRPTKVPYTDKGVAALEQQVIKALDEAVANGFVAPGTTIDGEFLPLGYKTTTVPVANVNQSDKEARHYPGLAFVIIGAGAIHSVQINGILER